MKNGRCSAAQKRLGCRLGRLPHDSAKFPNRQVLIQAAAPPARWPQNAKKHGGAEHASAHAGRPESVVKTSPKAERRSGCKAMAILLACPSRRDGAGESVIAYNPHRMSGVACARPSGIRHDGLDALQMKAQIERHQRIVHDPCKNGAPRTKTQRAA